MSTASTVRRRLGVLEEDEATQDASPIVIYLTTDTDEERQARAPPGASTLLFIPYNGRDPERHPGPPPALKC
jgi:hypothetical protein